MSTEVICDVLALNSADIQIWVNVIMVIQLQLIKLKAANYLTLLFDLFLEVLFNMLGSRVFFLFFILFHYLLSKEGITVMLNSSHSFYCRRLRKKTHHRFLRKKS